MVLCTRRTNAASSRTTVAMGTANITNTIATATTKYTIRYATTTTATAAEPTVTRDEFWNDVYEYPTYNIDLTRDADQVSGKPGDYIKLLKAFVVYPVLEFRISKEF